MNFQDLIRVESADTYLDIAFRRASKASDLSRQRKIRIKLDKSKELVNGEQNDSLLYEFDKKTGLISNLSAQHYRGQDDIKTPWLIEFTEWKIYQSVKIPVRFELIWEDEGSPWSYWTVENLSVGG